MGLTTTSIDPCPCRVVASPVMTRAAVAFACAECGHRGSQWAGRCSACGAWGTIGEAADPRPSSKAAEPSALLGPAERRDERIPTGIEGLDRVLGGGVVPGSVILLAGEPGIGKSTLLLLVAASLVSAGRACLLVSGEESRPQVADRASRLGLSGDIRFAPGRDLDEVIGSARASRPFLLAVDSVQALRDTSSSQAPGGVASVRTCADALVGLAKSEGIAVLMTGHVTKEGDLAGPRALEHAVDVVITFDGDGSGLRVLCAGKNRFGAEGESAWFEMAPDGLHEVDPTGTLVPQRRLPGSAVALPRSGRRALAVEVQALVGGREGSSRRQATGVDPRRFQQIAAVVERCGARFGRADLFAASIGGFKLDDAACDLAVAVALASASEGVAPPPASAFVGEVALTGMIRPVPALAQRIAAARAAGLDTVFVPSSGSGSRALGDAPRLVEVTDLRQALSLALSRGSTVRPLRIPTRQNGG
jgi:DNA repair protein RadA/Sms